MRPVSVRPATSDDADFIGEMLAEAAHEPEVEVATDNPDLARYVEGWGREGDLGFLADRDGELVGAAWLRLLTGENRGFGYVGDETPELAVAVRPEFRGEGIGTMLLGRLLEAAKARHPSASLSVRRDNPALRLYERMGFEAVEGSQSENWTGGESVIMELNFN